MKPVSFMRTAPTELGEGRHHDYTNPLSLDELLVSHPSATFFVRVGKEVEEAGEHLGIAEGDLLVIDRSVSPTLGKLVLAAVEGELVVRRYTAHKEGRYLVSGSPTPQAIPLTEEADVRLWGTVTAVVRSV